MKSATTRRGSIGGGVFFEREQAFPAPASIARRLLGIQEAQASIPEAEAAAPAVSAPAPTTDAASSGNRWTTSWPWLALALAVIIGLGSQDRARRFLARFTTRV